MLPAETFTDVISFLGYYDLGGLKLTNKLFASVASQCADTIRLFDFSGLAFSAYSSWIEVYQVYPDGRFSQFCQLELNIEENLAEFISEAFRNCAAGRFPMGTRRASVLSAIKAVAKTIVIAGTLRAPVGLFDNDQELFEFVDSFCRIKTLAFWPSRSAFLDQRTSLENFCGRKNIALRL